MSDSGEREGTLYQIILDKIFRDRYEPGMTEVPFVRADIPQAAKDLGVDPPKNLGDAIYALRYRTAMPPRIVATQPEGMEWIIEGRGRSRYALCLVKLNRILPRTDLVTVKVPDATPEIIASYALNDEQSLLAIVRYNRLIDIFLGLTTYSLQSHLRTTAAGSQIEIDELYVGLDRHGAHYVIPVQAKGGNDQISSVQTKQDIQCCAEKFPGIACRAVSTQFMTDNRIAMFELAVEDDMIRVAAERHYRLVPADKLDPDTIRTYRD